ARTDAANTTIQDRGPGRRNQRRPTRPLCLLRCRRESSVPRKGVPRRGALLETDVVQPQLGRATLDLGEVQPDQSEDAVTETKAAPPLPGVAGSCSAVNHLPKSVVREIRTPRSVGTGGGRPPPVTRWMWKRSHGRTSEAPPDERGGYRYVRPTATAPHLDSTLCSRWPTTPRMGENAPNQTLRPPVSSAP